MNSALIKLADVSMTKEGERAERVAGQWGWLLRYASRGRPGGLVTSDGSPATLPYDATWKDFLDLVANQVGVYKGYPIDEFGREIPDAPVIEFEIREAGTRTREHAQVFGLVEQFMSYIETKDMIISEIIKSLVASNENLQVNAANLLSTATTTINVATGVERPELDIDAISEHVKRALREDDGTSPSAPWFVQLANGPMGQGVMKFVSDLTVAIVGTHKPAG